MGMSASKNQSGVALIIALVFLTLIALMSTVSMQSSRLAVYMAGNEQARLDAGQRAQSVIDAFADEADSFRVTTMGYLRCNAGHSDSECDAGANLAIANSDVATLVSGATELTFSSEFYYEATSVPEASLGSGNESGGAYGAAYFDVMALYDNSDNRGGRAEISQGIGVRVPTSSQSSSPTGTDSDTQMQLPL